MTVHSESKNSISVLPSTKQFAISSSGSNSHAETPFSWMARYCDSEISVCTDSGGFAVTKAIDSVSDKKGERAPTMAGQPTLGSEVFGPLHVVHRLEGLGLLPGERLLVIVLAGPTDAVEKDASRRSVSKEIEYEEDDGHQDDRPERREEGDDDAIQPRAVVVHLDGSCAGSCVAQSRCVDGRSVASSIRDLFRLPQVRSGHGRCSVSGDVRGWVVRRGRVLGAANDGASTWRAS